MRILGIQDGHSASAALVEDGRILAAVQEERLTRSKNQCGFPELATSEVLRITGLRPVDLDAVAFAGRNVKARRYSREDLYRRQGRYFHRSGSTPRRLERYLRAVRDSLFPGIVDARKERRREDRRQGRCHEAVRLLGIPLERIRFVDHHACHAAAGYYGQRAEDGPVLVVTADGVGDRACATARVARNGDLGDPIVSVPPEDSPAMLYALITYYLGFVPLDHEHKLMGMAPYAVGSSGAREVRDFLASLIPFPDGIIWRRAGGMPPVAWLGPALERGFRFRRFDDIAAGLQEYTEHFYLRWVQNLLRHTGISRLALSGGLFMNVKLNKLIMSLPDVTSLFVFPSCGDESNSIGAAYALGARLAREAGREVPVTPAGPAYWGPEVTDSEVERAVSQFPFTKSVRVTKTGDIEAECAERLACGDVVARFKGRMEFGARALGNRSILARPDRWDTVRLINTMIKKRDFWMPFAPSVLAEEADRYLVNPKGIASPYMVLAFDSCPAVRDSMAAVVHPYDGSCRPQIVEREWNPDYHRLIRLFAEKTGHGAILNTSFNLHGQPIVGTPAEALEVFDRSGLRCLALNDLLIEQVGEEN